MDLILQILTNPDRVTKNLVTFYGNPLAICYSSDALCRRNLSISSGLASHNSMRNTEDRVGKKTGCEKEEKEKKKRGREKYRNRLAKKDHILAYAHAQATQKSD